jgi:hypothetical protein
MNNPRPSLRGHVILVATPSVSAQPTYRAYLVAEDDPAKAQDAVARNLLPGETAYVLAAFPDVLRHIQGLESGGALRL